LTIADALYAAPLGDFTPARDARVKELKADKPLAAAVKALRKPSLSAWVVNLLVRREADQVAQVLSVGRALRDAQASLDGDELRALTRQRRQLTAAVTARARGVAADAGVKVTQAVADQVEATLTAAMLDAGAAEAVRSGLLVAALAPSGVDAVDVAAAVAVPEALGFTATPRDAEPARRPDLHVVPDPEPDERARREAQEALAAAEEAVGDATTQLRAAHESVSELEARGLQLQSELDELRRRLAELEATYEENDDELGDAEDARGEAESALASATKVRDAAGSALDGLS
ncbi:MAG: hypothetical protein ABIQ15_07110, partial [Nocardioides sp.]